MYFGWDLDGGVTLHGWQWMILCRDHEVYRTFLLSDYNAERLGVELPRMLDLERRRAEDDFRRMGCFHDVPTLEMSSQ